MVKKVYQPKKRSKSEHVAMFEFLTAKLKKNLVEGRYNDYFNKPEMESLITACIFAGYIAEGKPYEEVVKTFSEEHLEKPGALSGNSKGRSKTFQL